MGHAAAAPVGEVVILRGVVTAQLAGAATRLLGKGAPINEGEIVSTARKSFVLMNMHDGTRMALRPNTTFEIETWQAAPGRENAALRLFKGGLRAISGAIAKRNSNAFRLNTTVATIGIRGTTFDAWLCDEACRAEARNYRKANAKVSTVVGRVGFLKGSASANEAAGSGRDLSHGAPIYVGETITTERGSYAILVFKDRSRVTLRPDTAFRVDELTLGEPSVSAAAFRLLRGGIRAVTGLIAKRNPSRVRYASTVATIGIRGTGFDMSCGGDCSASGPNAGLTVSPWRGEIVVETARDAQVLTAGQVAFFGSDGGAPKFLPQLPSLPAAPKPEDVEIDEAKLLDAEQQAAAEQGLYVACHEGYCLVGDLPLGAGETAYSPEAGGEKIRLDVIPEFLSADPYFKTIDIDPDVAGVLDVGLPPDSELNCVVP